MAMQANRPFAGVAQTRTVLWAAVGAAVAAGFRVAAMAEPLDRAVAKPSAVNTAMPTITPRLRRDVEGNVIVDPFDESVLMTMKAC
jgi:hypothetical protein